jgi:hypothetical protein
MYVHALHTVHALPDLRVAAGRLRDGFYRTFLTISHHQIEYGMGSLHRAPER